MVIEGLRQEGHPLQFMLERMKMARSTYYHCAHANYDDGHDELRKKSERFLKIAKRYMAIGAYG